MICAVIIGLSGIYTAMTHFNPDLYTVDCFMSISAKNKMSGFDVPIINNEILTYEGLKFKCDLIKKYCLKFNHTWNTNECLIVSDK